MQITRHSKQRIVQRSNANFFCEAVKIAKIAYRSGKTINYYADCRKFSEYLRRKRAQTCECSIRVYQGNIFIWKGRSHVLVTAHPIPVRFKTELEAVGKWK